MTNLVRPMFPPCIDSTMLSTFRSCPQKFFRTYMEHWKPEGDSVHLVAGAAFAKGLEVARREFFESGNTAENAVAAGLHALILKYGDFECPPESAKSLERMCGALEFYFEQYPLQMGSCEPILWGDGRRGIEFSFAQPLDFLHPVSGDPLIYTGRADMIANFAGGIFIFDEKTTSQLGASWTRQWELRSQFTGYCWAARESGMPVNGAVVRGVSILKTKYDTLQHLTYRPDWEIERWLNQINADLRRMVQCWEEGWWDYDLDHACAEYGGCSLQRICKSENPQTWLPMQFEQRVWDPLGKANLTIDEWQAQWPECNK